MNERIFELAKQCGYWSGQTIEMNDVGIEKFAELIVKECVGICESGTSTQTTSSGAAQIIKQHFGVE